ncbi:hypothetical protein PGIGA_G00211130 [Pangasianodon gigas]|uniref:Uncharacterized protein n=1 Tax=Pangasianodon gigas TaxID=30993 RepID=A0ACC5WGN1_PANGG|nr:hypothetical protein [Pangasianodon gigas]
MFQRLMDFVLCPYQQFAAANLEDIVSHSNTWTDHVHHLRERLKTARTAMLSSWATRKALIPVTLVKAPDLSPLHRATTPGPLQCTSHVPQHSPWPGKPAPFTSSSPTPCHLSFTLKK